MHVEDLSRLYTYTMKWYRQGRPAYSHSGTYGKGIEPISCWENFWGRSLRLWRETLQPWISTLNPQGQNHLETSCLFFGRVWYGKGIALSVGAWALQTQRLRCLPSASSCFQLRCSSFPPSHILICNITSITGPLLWHFCACSLKEKKRLGKYRGEGSYWYFSFSVTEDWNLLLFLYFRYPC